MVRTRFSQSTRAYDRNEDLFQTIRGYGGIYDPYAYVNDWTTADRYIDYAAFVNGTLASLSAVYP